jgi:hypothetical protein
LSYGTGGFSTITFYFGKDEAPVESRDPVLTRRSPTQPHRLDLEEKAHLLRRIASRADRRAAAQYEEEAQAYENHAAAIREMLAQEANPIAATASE